MNIMQIIKEKSQIKIRRHDRGKGNLQIKKSLKKHSKNTERIYFKNDKKYKKIKIAPQNWVKNN